jgi:hypothetical protein
MHLKKKKEKNKKEIFCCFVFFFLLHIPIYTFYTFFSGQSKSCKKLQKYYHRGSNWGSSTRGTALTRYVFIGCCDSGNNPDSNACQNTWRKYIWTPLKIGPGLVMWWSMNNMRLWPFCLVQKTNRIFLFFFCCGNTVFTIKF